MVELLELVLVEESSCRRVGVEEDGELGAVGGDGGEKWEVTGEVLDEVAESLELAREVDHPLMPVLKVSERLVLEPVGDNTHTVLERAAGAEVSDGLPENILSILGRHAAAMGEHRVAEHGRAIGEVGGEGDNRVSTFPALRGELEEACIADTDVGVGTDVFETRIKAWAGEVARGERRETDLVEKRSNLGVGESRHGNSTTRLINPISKQSHGGVHLRLSECRTRRSLGTLELLHAVFKHGESAQVFLPAREDKLLLLLRRRWWS